MEKGNRFMERSKRVYLAVLTILLTGQMLVGQDWYNANWLYRNPVTVSNSGAEALSYIQVMIGLGGTFNFSQANSDGSDLRVTSDDGTTPIPFWIENWDDVSDTATIWVKVPAIPVSGTTVYLYYGNASASSLSDGKSTFAFFDDFESWGSSSGNTGWTDVSVQPIALADQTSAVYNGRLYVFGGYTLGDTYPQNTSLEYDPVLDSWEIMEPMPTARWGMVAVEFEGLIYVFGGSDGPSPGDITANEVYDPDDDSWTVRNNIPADLGHTGIMGLKYGNRIHLFYGRYHYEYNPYEDTYIRLADVPNPRYWSTCATDGSRIYIIGGGVAELSYLEATNDNQIYDPVTDSWSTGSPLPIRTWGTTRENPVINGRIYVAHGIAFPGTSYVSFYSTNYEYNPLTDSWTQRGSAAYPRDGTACGVIDNKLYVVGGRDNGDGPVGLNYHEVYDPAIDTWTPDDSDMWAITGTEHVFVDPMATYSGSNGLVIQQAPPGQEIGYPDAFRAMTFTPFGDVYALDLRWNMTDDLGIGTGLTPQPQGWILVSDEEADGGLFFYRRSDNTPVVEWSYGGYSNLQSSSWDAWHNVTIVRDGSNTSVTFDGNTYSSLGSSQTFDGGSGRIKLGVYFASRQYFDNVRVRKWGGFDPETVLNAQETGNFREWTGVTDNNWSNSGNWSVGGVPGSTTNTVIRNTGFMPHVDISSAECNSLTIDENASLYIDAGQALTVNGSLFISGTGSLTVQSASLLSNGSLIVLGNSTGNVTYNRQLRVESSNGDYHYFSSPVSVNSSLNTDKISAVWQWNEASGTWSTLGITQLVRGHGYNLDQTGTSDGLISFTGPIVTSDIFVDASSPFADIITTSDAYSTRDYAPGRGLTNYGGGGWNMLGNPFTSSILVESFIDENRSAFDPNYVAVYLYDGDSPGHSRYYYIGESTGWGEVGLSTHVQAGQGFFVLAMNDYSLFSFNRGMQGHNTSATMLKSKQPEGSRWPGLRVKVKSGDYMNSTTVIFGDEMSLGLDPGYDVGLMTNGPGPGIYSILVMDNGVNFARQALPINGSVKNIIPLGVDFKEGGEVTFSADVEPLRNYKFLLEDRQEGSFTDLGSGNYTTTIPSETFGTGRFYLHVSTGRNPRDKSDDKFLRNVRIWSSQERDVYIQGAVGDGAVCQVYNLAGRLVFECNLTDNEFNSFKVPSIEKGVFLIKLIDGPDVKVQRVVLL